MKNKRGRGHASPSRVAVIHADRIGDEIYWKTKKNLTKNDALRVDAILLDKILVGGSDLVQSSREWVLWC
jgi:hypothetical protein